MLRFIIGGLVGAAVTAIELYIENKQCKKLKEAISQIQNQNKVLDFLHYTYFNETLIQVISATSMLLSLLLKSYHRKLQMVS